MEDDPRDELHELLQRIREIAALNDVLALEQVAELVEEVRYGGDWQRERARAVLTQLRAETEYLANSVRQQVAPDRWWRGREFKRRIEELGSTWPADVRSQFAGDIAEVKHAAMPVAQSVIVLGALATIQASTREHIASSQVADRILRELDSAEESLREGNALEQHADALRAARERAARYRWRKKVDEAEVAEAGGNAKKATKLRAEARVVLRQDWVRAFPREPAPEE